VEQATALRDRDVLGVAVTTQLAADFADRFDVVEVPLQDGVVDADGDHDARRVRWGAEVAVDTDIDHRLGIVGRWIDTGGILPPTGSILEP
jgi:hypothetical protein